MGNRHGPDEDVTLVKRAEGDGQRASRGEVGGEEGNEREEEKVECEILPG